MAGWGNSSRFISRTDQTLSSNDESTEVTRSAPALSRKEPSDDSNSSSKFFEAMQNPNWRRRPEDSGSYSSFLTELENCDSNGWIKPEILGEMVGSNSLANSRSSRIPVSSDRVVCPPQHLPSRKDFPMMGQQYSNTASNGADKAELHRNEEIGLYEVIKHVNLPGIQSAGKHSSIFEITPSAKSRPLVDLFGVQQDPFRWNLVQARRIYKENHVKTEKSSSQHNPVWPFRPEQSSHLPYAYQGIEAETRMSGSQFSTSRMNIEKARKAVLEDPAVADVGECYRVSEINKHGESLNVQSVRDNEKQKHLLEKQLAFQKMLSKLNKNSLPEDRSTETLQFVRGGQINPHRPDNDNKQGACATRYPKDLRLRDSGLDFSSRDSHEKEHSGDSAISVDSRCQGNSLNPRAREFLSYKPFSYKEPTQGLVMNQSQDSLPTLGYEKTDTREKPLMHESLDPASIEEPSVPFPIIKNKDFQPLSSILPPGFMGPFLIPTLPGLGPLPSLVTPLGVTPYPHQGQQFNPPPGFPPSLPPSYPLSTTGFNNPSVPEFNSPAYGPAFNSRPFMPVPKPRKPDATTQQAYEAYLEWRKTNEPGYAMECKRRQQRRAQRQAFTPSQAGANEKPSGTTQAYQVSCSGNS